MSRRLRGFVLAIIAAVGVTVGAGADLGVPPALSSSNTTALTALEQLPVVPARPRPGGFDRSCKSGRGCVFGPAWSDDVDVDGGHNGCSTRNDVLRRDLSSVSAKPGARGCVVVAGILHDPYTGVVVEFTKGNAGAINIDHVFPLAAAWDLGAAGWSSKRRQDFANDPRNLLAVSASANAAKGDRTPGDWAPDVPAGRCLYALRYVETATAYRLPVTPQDKAGLRAALLECS